MSKYYHPLLSFILFLFVFLYFMLSYYSRLATDDYYFIWDVRTHGIIPSLHAEYMEWSGRFSAGIVADAIYYYLRTNQPYYFFYPIASLIMLLSGSYFMISNILKHFKLILNNYQRWIAAFLFTATLFFLSIDIGESWFWYCSLSCYLWSVIAFIWGIGFLAYERHFSFSIIAGVICFVYIGGASEFNSVTFGIIITAYLIYRYRKISDFKNFKNNPIIKKTVIAYIALGVSFILLLIAPGNYLRDGLFPEHHFFHSFFIVAKSIVKFLVFYFPLKVPYLIAFATPFIMLGKDTRSRSTDLFSISFKSFFIRITLYLIALVFIFFLLVAYVMVETGPPRVWFLLSFLITIYFILLFFYAGYCNIFSIKQLRLFTNTSIITGFTFLIYYIFYEHNVASKYAFSCDERIKTIKSLNQKLKTDTIITLKPLAPCGMLYSAEIKSDTNHFTNKELRIGYNLKFHVIVENKEP